VIQVSGPPFIKTIFFKFSCFYFLCLEKEFINILPSSYYKKSYYIKLYLCTYIIYPKKELKGFLCKYEKTKQMAYNYNCAL